MKQTIILPMFFFCIFLSANLPVLAQTASEVQTVFICEGEKAWIECKEYEIIEIVEVFWGRDDYVTCHKVPTGLDKGRLCETNTENALAKVNGQCKNEQVCELVASNIFFDDNSCGNVYKYLRVRYKCNPDN